MLSLEDVLNNPVRDAALSERLPLVSLPFEHAAGQVYWRVRSEAGDELDLYATYIPHARVGGLYCQWHFSNKPPNFDPFYVDQAVFVPTRILWVYGPAVHYWSDTGPTRISRLETANCVYLLERPRAIRRVVRAGRLKSQATVYQYKTITRYKFQKVPGSGERLFRRSPGNIPDTLDGAGT